MRVLYVTTEVYPVVKTGGLADVNAALPAALTGLGIDVRFLLPGFAAFMDAAEDAGPAIPLDAALGVDAVSVVPARLGGVPAYLIDAPAYYRRRGTPYGDLNGRDWPDNVLRFGLLGWVAAKLAETGAAGWRPEIVHGHDWHAGLAPAYVAACDAPRAGTVITVHNLAFQGVFPGSVFPSLGLPPGYFGMQGVEFHGNVSFLKAGLHFADRITTVSPTYAKEIQGEAFGFGLDGLLRSRAHVLSGILNGVDRAAWTPAADSHLPAAFDVKRISGKARCKAALRAELGLAAASGPLFGVVSRITEQKGLDLLLAVLPALLASGSQLVLLGTGDPGLAQEFTDAAARHPGRLAVRLGYDEGLAHRIFAGADVVVVPSRFEPCGLTQMYGLAYGAVPLVRRVGGLADTVRDADPARLKDGTATGFTFDEASPQALLGALDRVLALWGDQKQWRRLRAAGMREDFSWAPSAARYAALYRELRPGPAQRGNHDG